MFIYSFITQTNVRVIKRKEGTSICEKFIQFELLFKRDGLFDKISDH